jgi:hypothetical protein
MRQTKQKNFVLCIKNDECDDLELRKVYQILSDSKAAQDGYVRIVDESGEDYLYPESFFAPISLSSEAQQALLVGR